jgi:protocatechuate 3,4-dioxygenase beta subunit
MVVRLDSGRGEPVPGVRVTLMAVRRNAEGLLVAALEGLQDCQAPSPPVGQESYGFCTATTNEEGRFEFEGVKPGLYVLTSSKEAATSRKLPTFGKRVVCELRAGMTVDVGRVEMEK